MKSCLVILSIIIFSGVWAQVKDSIVLKEKLNKTEVLTSGFIDVLNNGQVNASARFIRIFIGEPKKFAIPLSIYSGVSSNNFQGQTIQRNNDILVANFINPLSGFINLSCDGSAFFNKDTAKITRAGFIYHFGERILTGIKTGSANDPSTGKPVNFLNSYSSLGLYFQTGAWERNITKYVGICWLAIRYISCYTTPRQLKEIMATIQTNGFYCGYSIAWGVEINSLLNLKLLYYNYIKNPEIDYYLPIYQFTFTYLFKK